MNAPPDGSGSSDGAATTREGTSVPVDVSGEPRARGSIALLVAGPVIWTLHFLVVYITAEAGCTGEGPGLRLFDPPVPRVLTLAATAVAAVACLASAALAYGRWREDRDQTTSGAGDVFIGHGAALPFAGFLLSLLALVVVVFVGVPAIVLPPC